MLRPFLIGRGKFAPPRDIVMARPLHFIEEMFDFDAQPIAVCLFVESANRYNSLFGRDFRTASWGMVLEIALIRCA